LRNGSFQAWHGHPAREKHAISREMPLGITGKMPVPRYFATPTFGPQFFTSSFAQRRKAAKKKPCRLFARRGCRLRLFICYCLSSCKLVDFYHRPQRKAMPSYREQAQRDFDNANGLWAIRQIGN
jgi:hypothetical protein